MHDNNSIKRFTYSEKVLYIKHIEIATVDPGPLDSNQFFETFLNLEIIFPIASNNLGNFKGYVLLRRR